MATALMQSFVDDLTNDRFVLTSLPEVALNVRKALEDPEVSSADVAAIISRDPAIAAKLLRTANSMLFRGREACDTLTGGIARIGLENTRKLVTSFALKDLFYSESALMRELMQQQWEKSLLIGSIAHVLASRSKLFPSEEAMLAGVLSNIGVLSVFNYLNNYPELCQDRQSIDQAVIELKQEVGAMVLDHWAFPPSYLACALQGENWTRDTGRDPDLCDLIIVASWHARIGEADLPRIHEVPAYEKLTQGALTPEIAIEFMQHARDEVNEARAMLAA